ncbi:MAG: glycosyltransferase [Ignavibacteria bacterium]
MDESHDKVKIMHFVHSLNEGGIERLLYEFCRKLNKEKFEIQICCVREKGLLYNNFEKLGIKVFCLKAEKELTFVNFFTNLKKIFYVRKLLIKESIEITHGHEFYSTIFSRVSALTAGVKWRYITLHNVYYWWNKKVHFIQRLLSSITTNVICNSYSTFRYSLKHDKIAEEKYKIIYNGIDCVKFQKKNVDKERLLIDFGFKENDYICVSVGNLSFRKGFEYLIRSAGLLKEEHDRIKYLIIGGEHHEEAREYKKLLDLISELKLENTVKITGQRNDVDVLLNVCDLYIMPSVVEGFGLALAEAMSTEKLALVSDIETFLEIIKDGENGFIFKSKDPASLAEKILMIKGLNNQVADKIRIQGRQTIIQNFNLEQMVKNYELLYQSNK